MEELIEILIRLIAGLFENKPPGRPQPPRMPVPPGYSTQPPGPGRPDPSARPVAQRQAPAVLRNMRRVPPPQIAMARPILTPPRSRLMLQPTMAPPPPKIVVPTGAARAITSSGQEQTPSAAAIRNWLTPASLKQQFLLTEILQPPLALRSQHDVPAPSAFSDAPPQSTSR
jgi:hypothetical protein